MHLTPDKIISAALALASNRPKQMEIIENEKNI